MREDRSRLRVITAWGMRQSNSWEGKLGFARSESDAKMIFECADHTFGGVAAVSVQGERLEVNIVFAEGFCIVWEQLFSRMWIVGAAPC